MSSLKKIAFLVESTFQINHFGVRNYFSTIKNVLDKNNIVEFISYRMCHSGIRWYRVSVRIVKKTEQTEQEDLELKINNHNSITLKDLQKHLSQINKEEKRHYYQYIGDTLKNENYDICFITNPWCLNGNIKIDAKKIIGLVHDLIPNTYSFNKTHKDFTWGWMHNVGYKYYNEYCDKIVANSFAVSEQYKNLYPNVQKDKVGYFKPFVTAGFERASVNNANKENAIILAAPFDLRKGLLSMPKILNKLENCLDRIYIFGLPRCSPKQFDDFFKQINCKKITYYPQVSQEKLIDLYSKSKFLLFPSLDEGLGLPILEAQICGCRVVTTNKEPMNKLILNGSYVLTDVLSNDINEMKNMLNDNNFNYEELSMIAKSKFLYDDVEEQFIG